MSAERIICNLCEAFCCLVPNYLYNLVYLHMGEMYQEYGPYVYTSNSSLGTAVLDASFLFGSNVIVNQEYSHFI